MPDPLRRKSEAAALQQQLNDGVQHHQAGRLDEALSCYRQVLGRNPNDADAMHLSGVVAANRGQYDVATAWITRALALKPQEAVFHANLGNALAEQGRIAQAIESYREALRLQPGAADVRRNLSRACDKRYAQAIDHYGASRFAEADDACRQVLDVLPGRADAWHLSGAIANASGNPGAGIDCIQRAITMAPSNAGFHNSLGVVLAAQRRYAPAVDCYRRAIGLDAGLIDAHTNLAQALLALGQVQETISSLRTVIALAPANVQAHLQFAEAMRLMGSHDEAIAAARRAVELDPNDARVHAQLGIVLRQVGRTTEAIQACRRSLELSPHTAGTYNNLARLLKDQARMHEALGSYRQAVHLDPSNPSVHSNLLFNLHYAEQNDAQTILAEHRQWAQRHSAVASARVLFDLVDRNSERRLRIGYVSADLRSHSVAFFLEPLLAARDRSAIEVFCYSNSVTADTTTARLRALADGWREIAGLDDEQAAALIRADAIDILVDLAGHTKGNRLPLFTREPAPVQVTYLGYPDTTGIEAIDYRFTDERADPPGHTEQFHTEQLVRLAYGFLCYQPPLSCPEVGPLPLQQRGRVTFGSFNNLAKVSPTVIGYWASILAAVPDSRLLLKSRALADSGTREHIHQQFRAHGMDQGRVELVGWTPARVDHMGLYGEVDIALDTYPYHGTTTTCEALWMGVPVVTLAGPAHVSRVGVSLLHVTGLDELIAQSPQEYVRKAVNLAADADRLAALRSTMRERLQASPLTDAKRITGSIEVAYRHMWRQFCSVPPAVSDDTPALCLAALTSTPPARQ